MLLAGVVLATACGGSATAPADASGPEGGVRDGAAGDLEVPDAARRDAGTDAALADPLGADAVLAALRDPDATPETIETLAAHIGRERAWPLVDGTRVVYLRRWDAPPGAPSVVGDLNGWTPGATPAERLAGGRHWLAVQSLPPGTSVRGAKYKWHAGDTYVAPPEATAHGFDEFGEHGFVAPPTASPWMERFLEFPSSHLALRRTLRARLPAGFVPRSAAAARARVLLLHDGQNVFDPTAPHGGWRAGDTLDAPAFRDVVALAVDSAADRFDAYTHVTDDAAGTVGVGGRADAYWALLDEEALPFFESRYGVTARGRRLTVAGSSLGGLVSLYGAMRDDGRQACVIAMSPTLGWGSFAPGAPRGRTLIERWATERGHGRTSIYLDSGGTATGCLDADGDGVQDDGAGGDNSCETAQFRDVLAGLGYAFGVDLAHWLERGASHDEAAWAARLPRALGACAAMGWTATD